MKSSVPTRNPRVRISSPLLAVADGRILARQIDGTILAVREARCRRQDVVEALTSLQHAGGKLLGLVFVGSPTRGSYEYGSYPRKEGKARK